MADEGMLGIYSKNSEGFDRKRHDRRARSLCCPLILIENEDSGCRESGPKHKKGVLFLLRCWADPPGPRRLQGVWQDRGPRPC